MLQKEIHPFEPYIPENATKLIIGTIPPPRFAEKKLSTNDVNFYYGSEDNNFWNILGEITKIDFKKENSIQEIEKRQNFLNDNGIGICDIILKTNRKNSNSALDIDLENIEHLNIIHEILIKYPKIDTLLYTSKFVKTQMTQLLKHTYSKEICHQSTEDKKKKSLIIDKKEYSVVILYSPSRNANRRVSTEERKEQYKKYFNL